MWHKYYFGCVIIQLHYFYIFWSIFVRSSDVLSLEKKNILLPIYNSDNVIMSRKNWNFYSRLFVKGLPYRIHVNQIFFHDSGGFMVEICNCDNLPLVPLAGEMAMEERATKLWLLDKNNNNYYYIKKINK
jgi:hypothetical protein